MTTILKWLIEDIDLVIISNFTGVPFIVDLPCIKLPKQAPVNECVPDEI